MNDTIPHHQSSRCRAIWGPPQRAVFPGKSDVSQLTATSPVMISMQLNYVMQIFKDRGSFRLHPWLEVSNWSCGLLSPEGWEMRAASCVGRRAIILAFHLIQSSSAACAFPSATIFVIFGVACLELWFQHSSAWLRYSSCSTIREGQVDKWSSASQSFSFAVRIADPC